MNQQTATIENFWSHRSELAAYIDGELSPREELELEIHLAVCADCSAELNEQKKLLQALNYALEDKNEIELPADFTRVVVANAESKVSGLRRPQERFRALFICAVLLLLVLLSFGGETKTILLTSVKFAEQILIVAGFIWNLISDVAVGAAVILRSLSHQVVFSPNFSLVVAVGFVFVLMGFLSRFIMRFNRP